MRGRVLITRPIEEAEDIRQDLMNKNYDVFCEPLLVSHIHDNKIEDVESFEGIIFTSRNGVRAFCQNCENRELPIYCVGDATSSLATESGLKNVQSAGGAAIDLRKIIPRDKRLLYVRGEDITQEIEADYITPYIGYHADKKEEFSDEVKLIIEENGFSHVLFFSKRTADAFVENIQKYEIERGLTHTKALCLGTSMVKSVSVLLWAGVEVAKQPDKHSLMALLD